jgi:hypothetical protein
MDLMNGRFMGRFLTAAINYQLQFHEWLYQLRLEIGMLFLEMFIGPEITWEFRI